MILAGASVASVGLTAAAAGAYAVSAAVSNRLSPPMLRTVLWLAWSLHGVVLAYSLLAGTPRFGFAPALSVTAWLVLTVYAVERQWFPQLRARWALAALGAVAVLLAFFFPGAPLHMDASPWLALHLALGVASYGLFAAAVVHAALMRRAEKRMRDVGVAGDDPAGAGTSDVPLLTLERLTFRLATAGFVLLTATLAAGLLFGDAVYGPRWRWSWNHKTLFSVLAWMVFAWLLLGRARFGWRGRKAVRVLYTGAAFLLLAYVGSRFVLEVVLGRMA